MSFGKRVWPAQRVKEKIDLTEMVNRLGTKVPIEFKNEHGDNLAMFACVYTFSGSGLSDFIDEIIEATMDETLQVLRRKVMSSEWVQDESNT
jgi:hypothetical protein